MNLGSALTPLTALLLAALPVSAPARADQGTLVVVGGGLADDNDAVYSAFIDALPDARSPIVIVPAASGVPGESAAAFAANLVRRGIDRPRIQVARVAVIDDPSTPDDESMWRRGGEDHKEAAKIEAAGGIWFTGGDQSRVAATLTRSDGSDTLMLAAIRRRLGQGAVVGGTSAGAAIMSRTMILQGDVRAALTGKKAHGEMLRLGGGLGFLPSGLVDQHFGQRRRLGRLVRALSMLPRDQRIGIGIDEDTALVVRLDARRAHVAGRGNVAMLDMRPAQIGEGKQFWMKGAVLSLLSSGDAAGLDDDIVSPNAAAEPVLTTDHPLFAPCRGASARGSIAPSEARSPQDAWPGPALACLGHAAPRGYAYRYTPAPDTTFWRTSKDVSNMSFARLAFDVIPADSIVENVN